MLYDGLIIASGTPAELAHDPHPALREFVETSGLTPFMRQGASP